MFTLKKTAGMKFRPYVINTASAEFYPPPSLSLSLSLTHTHTHTHTHTLNSAIMAGQRTLRLLAEEAHARRTQIGRRNNGRYSHCTFK